MSPDIHATPHAGAYRLLYVDPPTKYETFNPSGGSRAASRHYPVLPWVTLAALPVADVAAVDCWLMLWATGPNLLKSIALMETWGFAYSTFATWGKRTRRDAGWHMGTGYVFRSGSEILLAGKRGSPAAPRPVPRGFWSAPLREHSRKPDKVRDDLGRCFGGPRLEMFGRSHPSPEWDVWGNEVGKHG